MINIQAGRYQVTLTNGNVVVGEATQAQLDALYRKLLDKTVLVKGYIGFAWIAPRDYPQFPVTIDIATLL